MKFLKLNRSMVNSLVVYKVGIKVSPKGFNPVMVTTSNKVGVNMPQGKWKVLVEPSHEKIDTDNMDELYIGSVLDISTMP